MLSLVLKIQCIAIFVWYYWWSEPVTTDMEEYEAYSAVKYHGQISVCDLLQIILTPCCRRTQIIQSFWSWSACTLSHHSPRGKFLMIDCTEPFVYPQVIWKMCLRREWDTASCVFLIWVFVLPKLQTFGEAFLYYCLQKHCAPSFPSKTMTFSNDKIEDLPSTPKPPHAQPLYEWMKKKKTVVAKVKRGERPSCSDGGHCQGHSFNLDPWPSSSSPSSG